MAKVLLFAIGCAFLIGGGLGLLECYFCYDEIGSNCEKYHWQIIPDCGGPCMVYQAKFQRYYKKNVSRYVRGCAPYGGCEDVAKEIRETYYPVFDIDCQECKSNLCNNRKNFPGHKYD